MIEKGKMISGRYEIIKSIGEGGMANVYVGYDTILNRKVAIKVLRGDLANDEKFVRRFQREALSASSLSHPNIVEMYDVGEDEGIYYIIMEYIDGKTLKQLIKKRGSITLSEAIDIMLQLTDGIAQAHDSYIIHRDLKPQNVMLKEDGTVKITDFGIAVALNSTQLTQTNSVMGSVHYIPPEQASGKGSTIRSDIYAMGILFYELLTGSLPFRGDNAVEIALKQMHDPIPSVRKKNPSIPQSVENIILKATAKNPKNRYADAKEMHADLLTALNDERMNEARLIFKYPEHDPDEKIVIKKKTETLKIEEEKPMVKPVKEKDSSIDKKKDVEVAVKVEEEDKTIKSGNRVIWILMSVFAFLILAIVIAIILIPRLTEIPDIKVPDVTTLSVIEAEAKLKEAGFEVAVETEKEANDVIEKGGVIRTSPQAGRSIKKGTTITIYESLGKEVYTMEDFKGDNYIEIQTLLESVHKLVVTIDKKEVDDVTSVGNQEIIAQSPPAGTKLAEGDSVTLYIPNILEGYPDFVEDAYTIEDVEAFCLQYGVTLRVEYEETLQAPEGTVLSQSRVPGTPIKKGVTLKVVIAKVPEISTSGGEDDSNLNDLMPQ